MRHRSTLVRQERPTGVGPLAGNQASSYNITITANKRTVVMAYGPDPDMDMFQVLIVTIVTSHVNVSSLFTSLRLVGHLMMLLIWLSWILVKMQQVK